MNIKVIFLGICICLLGISCPIVNEEVKNYEQVLFDDSYVHSIDIQIDEAK